MLRVDHFLLVQVEIRREVDGLEGRWRSGTGSGSPSVERLVVAAPEEEITDRE